MPEGSLTPTQYEILQIVWDRTAAGATVSEIWQEIATDRSVGRTTVLNLVDRLEKRGWLIRQTGVGANRYVAAMTREQTARLLASEFVNDFFGGSASQLVMSLLGERRLKSGEAAELRRLLGRHLDHRGEDKGACQ
jgi:predicted transcriptional regulator